MKLCWNKILAVLHAESLILVPHSIADYPLSPRPSQRDNIDGITSLLYNLETN